MVEIGLDDAASSSLIPPRGFVEIGQQGDGEDGLEIIDEGTA